MKRVLIVAGVPSAQKDDTFLQNYTENTRKLLASTARVDVTYVDTVEIVVNSDQLAVYDGLTGTSFDAFDLVIIHGRVRRHRDVAYAISRYCSLNNIAHFNDFSAYYSGSKVGQAIFFFEHQAPILKTVFCLDRRRLLARAEKELSFPFILKVIDGARGNSNYLVHTATEAKERLAAEADIVFLAQEYCPNESDYRILLTPAQELILERRGGQDTHLNNTSTGAIATLTPQAVPSGVVEKARAISAALGLTLAGVDVVRHAGTGVFYFLEVNSQPQIFTGAYTPEKAQFLDRFLRELLTEK